MRAAEAFASTDCVREPRGRSECGVPIEEAPVEPVPYLRSSGRISRLVALLLLLIAAPLIFILSAAIRLTSRGPAIYRQSRVGKHGRVYTMYKLRTMRADAESGSGPVWAQVNDPRSTRIGAFLREWHLDELPQLVNVVQGNMALVGPRPERPEIVQELVQRIPQYGDRLTVLPGITGLAQVNLPPDADIDGVRRKLAFDRQYIQTASVWLDIRLIAITLTQLFFPKKSAGSVAVPRNAAGSQQPVNLASSSR